MATTTQTTNLPYGLTLIRHYDGEYNIEQQCGTPSYYQQLVEQFMYQALEYYNMPDGKNKFLRHVVWHVYSGLVQMPLDHQAYCMQPTSTGEIHIHIRYFDPTHDGYKMPATLSHEMGHAYHNWCGLWLGMGNLTPVQHFLERGFSLDHSIFNGNVKPWHDPWNEGGRDENGPEQAANAYRGYFGAQCTRDKGFDIAPEKVVPGFVNGKDHPEWKKQWRLMPELCGYLKRYAMQPGTLRWQHGGDPATGWWEFKRQSDGKLIAQTDYYTWFERWDNTAWTRVYPQYSVV